jgi:hypothetical protein
MNLKGNAWLARLIPDHPSARCVPGDIPALAPYGTVRCEHGWPSPGPLDLIVAGGRTSGSTSAGGANARGIGSTGARDVGC